MGASAEEVESRALLSRFGTYVRGARHGDIWHLPGGASVMVQAVGTKDGARDWRAWRNTAAEIKRVLRAAEIEFEEKKEKVPVAATEATKVVTKTVAAMATPKTVTDPKLAALGVHVSRKRRVVTTEETEATVDLSALAAVLGLVSADDAQVEGAEVEMLDANGVEVEGPVVVRVRVTRSDVA